MKLGDFKAMFRNGIGSRSTAIVSNGDPTTSTEAFLGIDFSINFLEEVGWRIEPAMVRLRKGMRAIDKAVKGWTARKGFRRPEGDYIDPEPLKGSQGPQYEIGCNPTCQARAPPEGAVETICSMRPRGSDRECSQTPRGRSFWGMWIQR